jgi:hypothetical protein
MKRYRTLLINLAIFLLITVYLINIGFSQENTNRSWSSPDQSGEQHMARTETDSLHDSISVHLKFHNREIYYVDRPILVEFQIVNHSNDPYLFVTSYNKQFTFDFDIRTTTNRPIEHSKVYTIDASRFEPILNDKIALKNDEVYGVRIDIGQWFDLFEPGEYIIRGIFYPNLKTGLDSDVRLYSDNELYLYLNPAYTEQIRLAEREDEIRKLKAESLPPYEVVRVSLEALQDDDFEKYFIYVDFETFIDQFENASNLYDSASDANKPAIIEYQFKPYLRGENELEEMPFLEHIPRSFDIVRTEIERNDAVVEVIEDFEYGSIRRKKRYKYYLHLYDDKWLLQRYEVVNLP